MTASSDALIKTAHKFVSAARCPSPGPETSAQYAAECRRALAEGGTGLPPGSTALAYKRRAALVWAAFRVLETWIEGADVSRQELRGAVKILRLYPAVLNAAESQLHV